MADDIVTRALADDIVIRLRALIADLQGRGGELWDGDGTIETTLSQAAINIEWLRTQLHLANRLTEVMQMLLQEARRG